MSPTEKVRVLFVCLGNICRSPTAEGWFSNLVRGRNLEDVIEVDSAGTGPWHVGNPPDPRARRAALSRGYDIGHLRGRQVDVSDFSRFDYILAMDEDNLRNLTRLKPAHYQGHLGLFLDFGSNPEMREVPDPYYGGADGFDLVLDLMEDASIGLVNAILEHRENR
jgi:low molecular weight protein-tyrosine phosphatase